MKELLEKEIIAFTQESEENWFEELNTHFYDVPIIRYASADDPLFTEYKTIISEKHLTPKEFFENDFGAGSFSGGSVISLVFPVKEGIRVSNRTQKDQPSREWSISNMNTSAFLQAIGNHITEFLTKHNYKTVCPSYSKTAQMVESYVSNWSERHIAYVAGQGTFSLNEGFISDRGIAIRCLSLITELEIEADLRTAKHYAENCLYMSKGICGACMKRCPVNAISKDGHDKAKCRMKAYGDAAKALATSYGGDGKQTAGCALCQTNVPCEFRNPNKAVLRA